MNHDENGKSLNIRENWLELSYLYKNTFTVQMYDASYIHIQSRCICALETWQLLV